MILFFFILTALCCATLAYLRPHTALMLTTAALPLYTVRTTIFGIPTTLLETLLVPTTLVIIATHCKRARIDSIRALLICSALFVSISTAALLLSPHITAAAGIWKAYCIEPVLYALAAALLCTTSTDWKKLWFSAALSGTGVALVCIVQYATLWGIPSPWNTIENLRATAFYSYPNAVGLFLAPLVLFLCSMVPLYHSKRRAALILMIIIQVIAIYTARADGALASIMIGLLFLLIVYKKYLLTILSACAGVSALALSHTLQQIVTFQDVSGQVRLALWTGTLRLLTHQPFLGAGLANFPAAYDRYRLPSHVELLQYAHNIFLDFWAQFGLLGLVWLIGVLIFLSLRLRSTHSPISTALAVVLLGTLIYGLVDVPYFKNDLAVLFWLLCAHILTLPFLKKSSA